MMIKVSKRTECLKTSILKLDIGFSVEETTHKNHKNLKNVTSCQSL